MDALFFIIFLWFLISAKNILFYLYLWQLKEYHIGRFLDHFRTEKGKDLVFNPLNILKIFVLAIFPFFPLLVFFAVVLIYLLQFTKTAIDLLRKRVKKPVLTKKTALLILAALAVAFLFALAVVVNFKKVGDISICAFFLLFSDFLMPIFVSAIVLLFQPFAVFMRNKIIKKAKIKMGRLENVLVIGITGSYGKTSTKEFLYAILVERFGKERVLKTEKHQNSEVGISQCILNNLNEGHKIFICEMGAYNRGGIKTLCDIARPKIGVLTGINEQHMATFGSQENIIKAKYELIESLPKEGIAFFNAKNKYCLDLYNKTERIKKILYGEEAKFFGGENILGAMAVARELDMTEEEIKKAADKIENKFPGIEIKKGINGLTIIDATYSANPDGVMANLEYLKMFSGKKIIIMPCLIELGKASKEVHKRIGKKIVEVCDLAIITTRDRFKEIKEGMVEVKPRPVEILYMEDPKEIFKKINEFLGGDLSVEALAKEDVVLLESRVPKKLIEKLINGK